MRLNKEWRKFGRKHKTDDIVFYLHPGIPSQAEFVGEFLVTKGANVASLGWRDHLFYILHGFLIDCDCEGTYLQIYIDDVDGKTLEEAYEIHRQHPLLDSIMHGIIIKGFNATRDKSVEQPSLDVDSDADEDEVEKKELA